MVLCEWLVYAGHSQTLEVMTKPDVILGILAPALQVWIAGIILYRRLYRSFPLFAAYTLYSITVIFVRLWARGNTESYFVLYLVTEVLYGCLALLAIREAFKTVLESYSDRYPSIRVLLYAIVALLIGLPVFSAIHRLSVDGQMNAAFSGAVYSFLLVVRSIEVLVFGICLFRSRHHDDGAYNGGVILGFGVYAAVTLMAYLFHYLGGRFEDWYRYMTPGSYCMAAAIWLAAFLKREEPRSPRNTEHLKTQLDNAETLLQRYSQVLRKILKELGLDGRTNSLNL
jgi:hypothetical protein